ncbi:hypothetical protein CRU92_04045 [Arcobacter sp. FW59]|nr:hypothetical protein CRU92_04045 [Arcobacter sp. FW59]
MNRLNPLYLIVLFFVIVLISFISLQNQKYKYFEKVYQANELEIRIKEYLNVSNFYKNEKYINRTIDEILNSATFRNDNVVKTSTKDIIYIKFDSLSEQNLDNFLNRVLNKQIIIKKLELRQNSISLEVGLR